MPAEAADLVTLGRVILHLPAGAGDKEPWRRQVSQALGRRSLRAGLPPQAILVVRRLSDPLPGALLANGPVSDRQQWDRAARRRLEACWQQATRPALEPVPPSAGAVWFADRSEWLACLSWDLHRGAATRCWWWAAWLPSIQRLGTGDALFRLWQADARWLPPAMAGLQERHGLGEVQALLLRLSPPQAGHLRLLLLADYRLPDLAGHSHHTDRADLPGGVRHRLPAGYDALPAETAGLAALCLTLVHGPSAGQRHPPRSVPNGSATFGGGPPQVIPASPFESIERPTAEEIPPPVRLSEAELRQSPSGRAGTGAGGDQTDPGQHKSSEVNFVRPETMSPDQGGDLSLPSKQSSDGRDGPYEQEGRKNGAEIPASTGGERLTAGQPPSPGTAAVPEPDETQRGQTGPLSPAPWFTTGEQALSTRLGGLWYLVNVLGDLAWLTEEESALEPAPGAWPKLAGLGRVLLGEAPPDPIWEVLAAYGADDIPPAELRRWLAQAVPAVQADLAARLEQPEIFIEALTDPATLYVTRTHIDVIFSLEQIRLDLRLAGLDHNPGWVPELGHVVTFHYE